MSVKMLDWRDRPPKNQLISMIYSKLLEIDHLGKTIIEIAETTNTKALTIETYNGARM